MPAALEGVKVVELRQGIAAAYCAMLLGDLGAEVVLVQDEQLAADPDPPPAARLYLDRNKRALLLDPQHESGWGLLQALVGWADVVVEELLPSTLSRWGLDPRRWRTEHPRLIHASISPWGHTGPDAQRPGSDLIVQAMSGFMSITGLPEDPPTRSGTSLSEYYTGIATGVAILAALHYRERTGRGQLLDVALLDTLLTAMEGIPDGFFRTGEVRPRTGNMNPSFPGYGFAPCADGYVATAIQGPNIWPRFCAAIGRQELAERPQITSQEEQDRWGALVGEALSDFCRERTRAEIVERLVEHGVPAAPVNYLADTVREPPLWERGLLVGVDHPQRGRLTITGSPLHMTETPGTVRRPAPSPGQDWGFVVEELLQWPPGMAHALLRQGAISDEL